MKIPVHYSLKVARKVVSKVDLPKEIAKECTVESSSNCREQGLFIKRFNHAFSTNKALTVAQQRTSDNIIIIAGHHNDFDVTTNSPSEQLWNKDGARHYFRYNEVDEAAKFIKKYLLKEIFTKELTSTE